MLDLLGVAVGVGCTPYQAVGVAARWAPPGVGASLAAVVRACGLGASFDAALDRAVADAPPLRPVADALLASDRLGVPVAPALGRLAAEERAALKRRAEAHARAESRYASSSPWSSSSCPRSCCSRWSRVSRPGSRASDGRGTSTLEPPT